VSALTKLANPEGTLLQQTTASSFLSHRLARLAAVQPQQTCRAQSTLMTAVFAAVFLAGVFEKVAHTACCFFGKG
jgi:hypothetical protein